MDKLRYFDQGEYSIASNRVFLNKIIRRYYVHISIDGLRHPAFYEDWDKKIKVTKEKAVIDTFNIGGWYPLEIGEYFIIVEIDYWNKSIKHTAQSDEIPFTVSYLPKDGLFD